MKNERRDYEDSWMKGLKHSAFGMIESSKGSKTMVVYDSSMDNKSTTRGYSTNAIPFRLGLLFEIEPNWDSRELIRKCSTLPAEYYRA